MLEVFPARPVVIGPEKVPLSQILCPPKPK